MSWFYFVFREEINSIDIRFTMMKDHLKLSYYAGYSFIWRRIDFSKIIEKHNDPISWNKDRSIGSTLTFNTCRWLDSIVAPLSRATLYHELRESIAASCWPTAPANQSWTISLYQCSRSSSWRGLLALRFVSYDQFVYPFFMGLASKIFEQKNKKDLNKEKKVESLEGRLI